MTARLVSAATLALSLGACAGKPGPAAYDAVEAQIVDRGGLRTETAPVDAPFDDADLARNFERIALRFEANVNRPGGEDNATPSRLRRWETPVRWRLAGEAVTDADDAADAALFGRISDITRLDIASTDREGDVNFLILITTPEERPAVSQALGALSPRLADTFDLWRSSAEVVCAGVFASARAGDPRIGAAFVFIGAEVSGRLRAACIHEEIAQAFGLPNDHPDVRPSIFNDDQEFALLTAHDEALLRILYDPRLRAGMTAAEAAPVVRSILTGWRESRG
jgi:hypothetical protein